MSMADDTTTRPRLTGRTVLAILVGFFAVVLAVNGVLLYTALASWTGIGVDNAYQRGLAYNRLLAEEDDQARLGWTVQLVFTQSGAGQGRLDIALADRAGNPLDRAAVHAAFVRPTREGYDFGADLPAVGSGHYAADVRVPLAGQWEIRVQADHATGNYRLRERVMVR